MSVGLVLITHDAIGRILLEEVEMLLGRFETRVRVLGILPSEDTEQAQQRLTDALVDVDMGEGALIMTDVFGATPSNIAHRGVGDDQREIVHGLNLAMLMRAHNYGHLPLAPLVEKIIDGGRQSVFAGVPD